MMNVGYGRVSTADQNPGLQVTALKEAHCEHVFIDTISRKLKLKERPQLNACLRFMQRGDVLVVWKLDRLTGSLVHLINIMMELADRGVFFRSLTQNFDTTTSLGRLMMNTVAVFAEFEREQILERTRAGIAQARAEGVQFGRPRLVDEKKIMKAVGMYKDGIAVPKILAATGLPRPTFYRYLKQSGEKREQTATSVVKHELPTAQP
jgi:DNA invertase Pin-like site-specific DNA recombinase